MEQIPWETVETAAMATEPCGELPAAPFMVIPLGLPASLPTAARRVVAGLGKEVGGLKNSDLQELRYRGL